MNLEFLTEYYVPVIIGTCLCLGYVVKKWVPDVDNKYIPTINAAVGLLLAIWMKGWVVSPDSILSGFVSGLSATGLFEMFRNLLEGNKNA